VLIALGASVRTAGGSGGRELLVEDLLTGYYETALAPNELITSLHIPAQGKARAAYLKVTTGSADDWPALGVAVSLDTDGKVIKSARVVASAATPQAIRLKGVESVLAGKAIDDKALKAASDAACDEAEIVPDVRGSVPYKRELLRVYVGRAVRAALQADGSKL
jgi:carbon-monoxide dehydrogenase medium subunit